MKDSKTRNLICCIIILILSIVSNIKIYAQYYDFQEDNEGTTIYYSVNGTNATVVSGDEKYEHNVVIPTVVSHEGINYSVVKIGSFAFNECRNLTNIILPISLVSIGEYAFSKCTSLKTITIPNLVKEIGSKAFGDCSSLESVFLPLNLKTIEDYTFYNCNKLHSIVIPGYVNYIGSNAFQGCNMLSSVSIPNSVTTIESFAFADCRSLKSINLPNKLSSIEQYSFANCSKLTSLIIPNSVTSIDDNAFSGCTGLVSIAIPSSVTYIGNWAFSQDREISSVSTEINNPFIIGDYVFERDVKKNAILYVPNKTKDLYANKSGWNFNNIIEGVCTYLFLWKDNGTIATSYTLLEEPTITFSDGYLLIKTKDNIVSFPVKEISHFTYETLYDYDKIIELSINDNHIEDKTLKYSDNTLLFHSLRANSKISIYSLNGVLIFEKKITQNGKYAFSLSNLNTGSYIVKVNGLSYKIVKK